MDNAQKNRNREKHLAWSRNNKDKVAAHHRKSYLKNLEKRKIEGKKYYEENKERIIKRQSEYYKNNSESVRSYHRVRRVLSPEIALFNHARRRARKMGIEFSLTRKDILVPDKCPLLGIPIFVGEGTLCDNSPTLDRIHNNKGYVTGNVMVLSYKANRMKSNSTLEEFATMYTNWKREEANGYQKTI